MNEADQIDQVESVKGKKQRNPVQHDDEVISTGF